MCTGCAGPAQWFCSPPPHTPLPNRAASPPERTGVRSCGSSPRSRHRLPALLPPAGSRDRHGHESSQCGRVPPPDSSWTHKPPDYRPWNARPHGTHPGRFLPHGSGTPRSYAVPAPARKRPDLSLPSSPQSFRPFPGRPHRPCRPAARSSPPQTASPYPDRFGLHNS